jgi:predicted nucleic acid-binding protein
MKYMLDTNIFNSLLDESTILENLPKDGQFIATAMQIWEISQTKNELKRQKLLDKFYEVGPEKVPTVSALWGVTSWNEGCYGAGEHYQVILEKLNSKNKSKKNNHIDALIAETAMSLNAVLITSDKDLCSVISNLGGLVDFRDY